MLKRFLTPAAVALSASLCLAQAAQAGVVTFNDVVFPPPDPIGGAIGAIPAANGFDDQGLHFFSGQSYFIPAGLSGDPTVFPTPFSSTFWETYGEDVVLTLTSGGLFDFDSLRLGLGVSDPDGAPATDTVHMSWIRGGGCTIGCTGGQDLTLGLGFSQFAFTGLTGLSSVTIGPTNVVRYLAFDDISVVAPGVGEAVPEPAAWTLMILGFGGIGALMRRRRPTGVSAAQA